ncbi:MAG: hypothetical protein K2Y56_07160 [Methylobacterium sp.]|uniref:hypothetical protein n=1 Tax=Methylobacterium sp. TaxID=409 RepID=UPI0025EBAECE|nr:hypothetical protein [Methylobacterium sp.]MBX9931302.1 hypothetical protein [Methylobacterium sp.]
MTDETARSSLKDADTSKGGATSAGINPADVGKASSSPSASPESNETKEAIDRATASIGKDEG